MKTLLSLFVVLLLAIALPAVPLYGDSGSDDQSSGHSGKSGSGGSDDDDNSGSGSSGRNGADDPADQPDDNGGQRDGDQAEDNPAGHRSGDDHSNSGPSHGGSSGPGNGHDDDGRNVCADDRQGQPGDETTLTRIRRAFQATPAGQAIFAKGYVELRFIGPREKFKVEVEAMVAEGTTFLVLANGLAVGTVRIQFGQGELELSNEDGRVLPAALRPLSAVSRVEVVDDSGTVILSRQL